MPIPIRHTIETAHPNVVVQITDDGSRTLMLRDTGDCYHSGCGAIAETRHVYLENSGVAHRLANGRSTSVLEIGLGAGMGMLQTLDAAVTGSASLRYTACESELMTADILSELQLGKWLRHDSLAEEFIQFRNSITTPESNTVYQWKFADGDGISHCIEIHLGDLRQRDSVLCSADGATNGHSYDAIYFDPFAPDSNPELWETDFLKRMHGLLHPGGRLVTYCVSRRIRNAMESVGFVAARARGPIGGKREVLIATKPSSLDSHRRG